MLEILLIVPGVFLLMKGADYFVESASSLSKRLKVTPIVIGLTVVAFGTSAPELSVNMLAAINNNTDIAFGNIVGSNIANILLILGISATISKLSVNSNTIWKEIPFSLLAAILLSLFALQNVLDSKNFQINFSQNTSIGEITFTHGLVLLSVFIIFLYYTFGIAKNSNDDYKDEIKIMSLGKSITIIILSLITIILGGKLTVDAAVTMAKLFGISESLIGLTIVAVGTSLPELITSIVAAKKGEADLAIGNVVGSNIFNIFFILGLTATLKNIPVTTNGLIDIFVLVGVTVYTFLSLFVFEKHKLGKFEGFSLILIYIIYTIYLIIRG
jgi:cation:H+ antiporter